jgi:MFS family permease
VRTFAVRGSSRDERQALDSTALIDSRAGWPTVASTFLSTFTVFGVAYSFGAFFKPMADEFGSDRGATALFFSITTFLYFGFGVFTGRIADRIGPRPVLAVGTVCIVAGLLATSRAQTLWVGYLTYALGVGIGVACAYVPMVAAVGGWFTRQRTSALGLAVAGIGVGTLVTAPLAERLIDAHGWRRA